MCNGSRCQDGKVSLSVAEDLPVSSSGNLGRDSLDPEQYVTHGI